MRSKTSAIQGTGTADEMALEERAALALEGCVIADVAVVRPSRPSPQQQLAPIADASAAPEDQHEQEEVRLTTPLLSVHQILALSLPDSACKEAQVGLTQIALISS